MTQGKINSPTAEQVIKAFQWAHIPVNQEMVDDYTAGISSGRMTLVDVYQGFGVPIKSTDTFGQPIMH